jgi:hypothetical protein
LNRIDPTGMEDIDDSDCDVDIDCSAGGQVSGTSQSGGATMQELCPNGTCPAPSPTLGNPQLQDLGDPPDVPSDPNGPANVPNQNDPNQNDPSQAYNPPWLPQNVYRPPPPPTTAPNVDPGPINPTEPPPDLPGALPTGNPSLPGAGPAPTLPEDPSTLDRVNYILFQLLKLMGNYMPPPTFIMCVTCDNVCVTNKHCT